MIRLHDVTCGYGDNLPLRQFSCTLPNTGVVAISGASGSGKTTLLRLLLGRLPLLGGYIEGLAGLRFSVVFQEDRLLPWRTAAQNILLVNPAAPAEALLRDLGLEDAGSVYPPALSGGMQRRVAIARALAYPADVLLLDEPFKGLDDETRARVIARVRGAMPLTLLVTHDAEEAALLGAAETIQL
ncbi:MAG: ATP-binding cassette domain-containing protein [Christensenellaceae bacterium]|jgi:ABC-type nitrate/sulfonate/bicarbonate transport system ATPase subunit|nr:ATP-binding cassette domain-containing protein [Christensenellaceae bacterium]